MEFCFVQLPKLTSCQIDINMLFTWVKSTFQTLNEAIITMCPEDHISSTPRKHAIVYTSSIRIPEIFCYSNRHSSMYPVRIRVTLMLVLSAGISSCNQLISTSTESMGATIPLSVEPHKAHHINFSNSPVTTDINNGAQSIAHYQISAIQR